MRRRRRATVKEPQSEVDILEVTKPTKLGGALTNETICDIAVGLEHCVVWTSTSKLFSWGRDDSAQLGHSATNTSGTADLAFALAPTPVKWLLGRSSRTQLMTVVCGFNFTLATVRRPIGFSSMLSSSDLLPSSQIASVQPDWHKVFSLQPTICQITRTPKLHSTRNREARSKTSSTLHKDRLSDRLTDRLTVSAASDLTINWLAVWSDNATVRVWRPVCPSGWVTFGDVCERAATSTWRGLRQLQDSPSKELCNGVYLACDHPLLLVEPTGFELIWRTSSTGINGLSVWRPLPPSGDFEALGFVLNNHASEPPATSLVRCVHRSVLSIGTVCPSDAPLFALQSPEPLSAWTIEPPYPQNTRSFDVRFNWGGFFAHKAASPPVEPNVWCLRLARLQVTSSVLVRGKCVVQSYRSRPPLAVEQLQPLPPDSTGDFEDGAAYPVRVHIGNTDSYWDVPLSLFSTVRVSPEHTAAAITALVSSRRSSICNVTAFRLGLLDPLSGAWLPFRSDDRPYALLRAFVAPYSPSRLFSPLNGVQIMLLVQEDLEQLEQLTNFDSDELLMLLRVFRACCNGVTMQPGEFFGLFPQVDLSTEHTTIFKSIFRAFNTSHSGALTFAEFAIGLSALCRGALEDHIQFVFRVCDVDGIGGIRSEVLQQLEGFLSRFFPASTASRFVSLPGVTMTELKFHSLATSDPDLLNIGLRTFLFQTFIQPIELELHGTTLDSLEIRGSVDRYSPYASSLFSIRTWAVVKEGMIALYTSSDSNETEPDTVFALSDGTVSVINERTFSLSLPNGWSRRFALPGRSERDRWIHVLRRNIPENPFRFSSSFTVRSDCTASFFRNGSSYYQTLVEGINRARHRIFIADWMFSPGLYLLRNGEGPDRASRLDTLLVLAAERGVDVFLLIWQNSPLLPLESKYVKNYMQDRHERIRVALHNDPLLWSHRTSFFPFFLSLPISFIRLIS